MRGRTSTRKTKARMKGKRQKNRNKKEGEQGKKNKKEKRPGDGCLMVGFILAVLCNYNSP
jgi:hypothetical protein